MYILGSPRFRNFRLPAFIAVLLAALLATIGCATLDPALSTTNAAPKRIAISVSLPTATIGKLYNAVVSVNGGTAPYHFATKAGELPPGLILDAVSGSISGTPRAEGYFHFVLTVADRSGDAAGLKILGIGVKKPAADPHPVSVVVSPSSVTLAPGASHQFAALVSNTANTGVVWSVSAGKISAGGLFTAPDISSPKSIQLAATSMADPAQQGTATVSVSPPAAPSTLSMSGNLAEAVQGTSYTAALRASGGTAPYRWEVASGSLPSGFKLDTTNGVVSGLTQQTGKFPFTASVRDGSGQSVSRKLTIDVTPSSTSSSDGPAELPRFYVKSSLSDTPAPGSTHFLRSGGNLQSALDSAKCGDTISLEAGGTFTGKISLPGKNCDDNHWIIVRTSAPDTALPPEGTRLTPCYAGIASLPGRPSFKCSSTTNVLAKIVFTQSGTGPIVIPNGANHYRLLGLEITRPSSKNTVSNLIANQPGAAAHHIVLDRLWLHGNAHDETTRGLMLAGSTSVAVVDSFFSDFHCISGTGSCTDAQAIAGGYGDGAMGPYKIVNNYLEASGENILFGGGPATRTPEDIEIRRNFLFKPLIWKHGQPGFVGGADGNAFIVKNHFELKNAARVLFEGNVMENTWGGFSQAGFSILLTPKNQNGHCPLCVVHDVTIRYSTVSNVGSGIQIAHAPSASGDYSQGGWNFSIHDLTLTQVSGATYVGNGFLLQESSGDEHPLRDVVIDHLTAIADYPKKPMLVLGSETGHRISGFKWTNNIITAGIGLMSTGGGAANCAYPGFGGGPVDRLDRCFMDYEFAGNILIGATGTWPENNQTPDSLSVVGFSSLTTDAVSGLQLRSTSQYVSEGTDGKPPGADIAAITAAIEGVAR